MNTPSATTRPERGSAIVVVLALLLLIMAFLAGNDVTLRSLRREVQLIDQRQTRKYESAASRSDRDGRARSRDAAAEDAAEAETRLPDAPIPDPTSRRASFSGATPGGPSGVSEDALPLSSTDLQRPASPAIVPP